MMVKDLQEDGLLIKIDDTYTHRIGTCWKCGTVIEPLPLEQWYIKVKPLSDKAKQALKKKEVRASHRGSRVRFCNHLTVGEVKAKKKILKTNGIIMVRV
jgi:valyl-tRNA synthetase